MKPWLRFVLLINTVGGAWAGLTAIGTLLFSMEPSIANAVVFAILITPFVLGLYAGWLLLFEKPSANQWARIYLALQVPYFSSQYFGYKVISALGLGGSIGAIGTGLDTRLTFTGFSLFGSGAWISIWQGAPFGIGLNLVPVVLLLFVDQAMRQARLSAELT